jgi:hypothetical protein
MILLKQGEIPSSFVKLDSRITADDSYLDTASIQKVHNNHNSLIAQRIRRNAMVHACRGGWVTGAETIFSVTPYTDSKRPPVFMNGTLLITQGTQKVQFSFYARRTSALATDPELAVRFFTPGQVGPAARVNDDTDLTTLSITNSAYAWFTVDVELPEAIKVNPTIIGGYVLIGFNIYSLSVIDTANTIFAGAAITDSGANWVRTTGVGAVGQHFDCLYTSNVENSVGVVTGIVTYAAADRKFYIDPPWNNAVQRTDTLTAAPLNGIRIQSISITELPITDFFSSIGTFV